MICLRRALSELVQFVGGPQQDKGIMLCFPEGEAGADLVVAHGRSLTAWTRRRNGPQVPNRDGVKA